MADKKPNILVIWGDDIGMTNISACSQGPMGYRLAKEGMRFTDFPPRQKAASFTIEQANQAMATAGSGD